MTPARLQLAGWILRLYAARQVAKGCDDLDWPDWFPVDEREPLVREMSVANRDNADDLAGHLRMYATGSTCPPAWWLAAFFADRMGAPDLVTEW